MKQNQIKCPVSTDVLKSYIIEKNMGWGAGVVKVMNHDFSPMCFVENIICLDLWNILPIDGVTLDGHYQLYFHKDTMSFDLWKIGTYGNLISYFENDLLVNPTSTDVSFLRSIISDCILWDRNPGMPAYKFRTPLFDLYADREIKSQILLARLLNS